MCGVVFTSSRATSTVSVHIVLATLAPYRMSYQKVFRALQYHYSLVERESSTSSRIDYSSLQSQSRRLDQHWSAHIAV